MSMSASTNLIALRDEIRQQNNALQSSGYITDAKPLHYPVDDLSILESICDSDYEPLPFPNDVPF